MLKIILAIAFAFTALGILCAVWIARMRGPSRIGRHRPPAADPFSHPFGEVAPLPAGSLRELRCYSAGPASRADQGSGGNGKASQGAAAARSYSRSERRAR